MRRTLLALSAIALTIGGLTAVQPRASAAPDVSSGAGAPSLVDSVHHDADLLATSS